MTNKLFDFLRIGRAANTPPIRTQMRSVLLVLGLMLGSLNVWGAEVTTTFANKTSETWDANKDALPCEAGGLTWSSSVAPTGFESNDGTTYSARGLTFGSGASPVLSATQTGTITAVSIVASTNGSSSSLAVTIGTTGFKAEGNKSVSIESGTSNANSTYTFTGEAAGNISVAVTGTSSKTVWIKSITITYTTSGGSACATPTFSVPAGAVVSGTEVTITCTTEGAAIHYTIDGTDPTASSPTYSSAITIDADKTIKAIAVKDGLDNSAVATAAYTIVTPYTTIAGLFEDMTTTSQPVHVTFGGWQVSVVKNTQAFVTDGTNGLIIYQSGHGLADGDVLTGTVQCNLVKYNGAVELTGVTKTMDGISVASGTINPVVKTIPEANALSEINTGILVKLENVTYNGSAFVDESSNTIAPYTTFYNYNSVLTSGHKYNVIGIIQQYSSNSQIYPRSAADIEEIVEAGTPEVPTFSPAAGTYTSVQHVAITCATEGAAVYYTTNGDTPDNTSTLYSSPIEVGENMTIKAIAIKDDKESTATAAYVINLPLPSHDFQYTHNFTTGGGFVFPDEWGSSYAKHEIAFTNDKVVFESANKPSSGSAIEDRPVTKDKAISLVLTNVAKELTAVRFDYKQWGTKAQTLTMKYSMDGGENYSDFNPVVSSSNFALQVLSLPEGVNAIQVTGSSSDNQVGLTSISFDLGDKAVVHGSITYVENGANEDIPDVADAISLPDPLPAVTKSNHKFGGWFTDSEFNTPAVAGAALTGNVTLYAKWTEIPVWATTYTNNITMVHTGSGADNGSITIGTDEPYLLVKAGASNNTGTIEVTVPAQTYTLHFHAFAWGGKTAKIQIAGVDNPSFTEFDLAGESGASGGGNDFILAGDPVDQYFSVTFDAVSEETKIVFSEATGSADHRFFFYGVNQEGGVVPVLKSIVITGEATSLEYEGGDVFDPAGLGVNAIYTLNEVEQAPVAVDAVDIEWSFDPATLTVGTTSVTVTATVGGKTANKEITGLTVIDATPEITTDVNSRSWTVTKDADIPAAKTFAVTLKNVAAATAALGGTNPEAFSIDKTDLVNGDVITVSVVSTATVGDYTATITISDNASVAADKVVNVNLKVNAPEVPEIPVSTSSEWVVATDADLVDGAEVLITGVKDDVTYAMSVKSNNGNNRTAVTGTLDEGVFTPGENTMSFILEAQGDGTFALRASNGTYLYAASSSSNYLKTRAAIEDDNAKWTLTTTSAVANGSYTHNTMFFNSSSSLFACYVSTTTTQQPIAFYVPKPVTPPTPDYEDVRTDLTAGKYYTICYPKAMSAIKGATLWSFVGKDETTAYIVQESAPFAAGKPYILYATAETFEAIFEGEDASADSNNGLYGTLVDMDATDLASAGATHMLYNNEVAPIGTGNHLYANRAYIILGNITGGAPAGMPAHKVRSVPMHKDVITGTDELNASETPVKVLINGQLFILRGEKMYNANGQLVK